MAHESMRFTPQDFESTLNKEDCVRAAKQANVRLQEMLNSAPLVYGFTDVKGDYFCTSVQKSILGDTFTARLACIEEIKK